MRSSSASLLLHRNKWAALVALSSSLCSQGRTKSEEGLRAVDGRHDSGGGSISSFAPLTPIRVFNPNPNLEIAFDVRTRNPVYVLERLVVSDSTESKSSPSGRNRSHFYEEKSLPDAFRSRNGPHYHLSGYDRGHMAPAADFNHDPDQRLQTYNLTNASPQNHEMNNQVWSRLEEWARRVARKYNHSARGSGGTKTTTATYVVTGPLWLPARQVKEKLFDYSYPGIGRAPSLVAVATHFFKVVAVVREEEEAGGGEGNEPSTKKRNRTIAHFACFVVPNDASASSWALEDALVRWTDLEAVTGLELFPTLVDAEWKRQADAAVDRVSSLSSKPSAPSSSPSALLLPPSGNASAGASYATTTTTAISRAKPWKKWRAKVNHLCPNGTCQLSARPPKTS